MLRPYQISPHRPRLPAPAFACMATAAAVSALPFGSALAVDVDHNADLITDTIASQELRTEWNLSKLYGANTVAAADRSFAAPEGVRLGNFIFYPSVGQEAVYDSNIYGLAKEPVADWRFITTPTLSIQSDLPRHAFDMTIFGRFMNFADNTDQNYANFGALARTAIHIDHAHTFSATARASRENEERTASTAPRDAAEPVPIDRFNGSIGLTRDVGRLYGTVAATAEHLDFGSIRALDGSTLDQNYRDQTIYSAQLRAGYRFSPGYEIVGKVRVLRQYNDGETPAADDRNSNGYEAAMGLAFETSPLFRWRLLAGWGGRYYDRSDIPDVQTGLFEAQMQWLASDRLTVTANASHEIVDEFGAADNGRIETSAGAIAEYEIRHDLVANAGLEYADLDFIGSSRQDRVYAATVGLDYYYTKNWLFSAGYTFETRSSNEAEFDLDRSLVRVGAKLKF